MSKSIKNNLLTYGIFLCVATVGILYGNVIFPNFKFVRVWEFTNILILLLGVPFLFLQDQAKLPNFWQDTVTWKNRFLFPMAIGIIFGILDVLVFKAILHPEPYPELPPFVQPFPYSIFLYLSGAFEVEVFYRLIPLTLILLIGNWFKGGKYYKTFFWIGAVLTAIREPLEQLPEGSLLLLIYSLATCLLMNFLQALWYRKTGFLGTLSIRTGHYLVWHIALGMYIQYIELP
jgi:hypothetical protein